MDFLKKVKTVQEYSHLIIRGGILNRPIFIGIIAWVCLLPWHASAQLSYRSMQPDAFEALKPIVQHQLNTIPMFKKMYDELLTMDEYVFYVGSYTQEQSQQTPKAGFDTTPQGMFIPPYGRPNQKYGQIGFRLEQNFPMMQSHCGRINMNTFKGREFVIFQEFMHAGQWLYYHGLGMDTGSDKIKLIFELEVELLQLIAGHHNCINEVLLEHDSFQQLLNRYQHNASFIKDDKQQLEEDLVYVYEMLLGQGPSYAKHSKATMDQISMDDFQYLTHLLGPLLNPHR
jgi:hypothetical protein